MFSTSYNKLHNETVNQLHIAQRNQGDLQMIDYGKPKEIPPVEVRCGADEFENMIREFGVVNACEWFGHTCDSEFTKDTVEVLLERSGVR